MEEIIIKMIGCLIVALALGFIFGWFVKRALAKETYEPKIEALETNLTTTQTTLEETQKESALIKEQFLSAKKDLDASNTTVATLKSDIETKERHVHETLASKKQFEEEMQAKIDETLANNIALQTSLDNTNKELQTTKQQVESQKQETARVKEHHALLKNEVTKLEQDKGSTHQEVEKLSALLNTSKDNESKLLVEKIAHENKLTELEQVLNEKNIAAIELTNKVKEIDTLNIKTSELQNELSSTTEKLKEVEEKSIKYKNSLMDFEKKISENQTVTPDEVGQVLQKEKAQTSFFGNLEHSLKDNISGLSDKITTATSNIKSESKGFDFKAFAQKTMKKITESGDEINKKADKVIQEYKDKNK